MHILPQLRKLERKYNDSLVVVGVHSSKFPSEKETANIRNAVMRYGIEHPVVNDRDFEIWRSYAVRAWPTLMFIDPQGKVIGKHEGEFDIDRFDALIGDMVREFEAIGQIDRRPLPFQIEAASLAARVLAFPGKIEADAATGRLFIADSNHDRILSVAPDGGVLEVIGSGEPGFSDGGLQEASFNKPQGMAVDGDRVYVADAENHSIRLVDLRERTVRTIAGTGEQSLYRHKGGLPLANPLNSPYDLALHDGVIYIAMAGFHQLWALDLREDRIFPYAGDGGEDIVDGPREQARCAQPYGVKTDGHSVYFADSETSSVRTVGIGEGARVHTLVGRGLFDFGDVDGDGSSALLQHCQGIALWTEAGVTSIYVADTYNNRIKKVTMPAGKVEVATFAGTGEAGKNDRAALDATFDEPAGLAVLGDRLYVADTNNHAIRVIDLEARGNPVATLDLRM
jgi:DNA-binding beta-propeller fold protein YncE